MVEEATGAAVLVGGLPENSECYHILRLSDTESEWTELPTRLSQERCYRPVAFLVPDSYAECVPSSK